MEQDHASQIAMRVELGCPPDQAEFLLQAVGGNIELAMGEFFASMEEGGGAPGGAVGASESEGEETEDSEDDDLDGDADMAMVSGYASQSAAAPSTTVPPPPKRAKVEMRQVRAPASAPAHVAIS